MKSRNQRTFRQNRVEGGSLLKTGVHDDRKNMDAERKEQKPVWRKVLITYALRMKMKIAVPVSVGWGLYSPQLINWGDGTRTP
jgi:hypothetical protein